MFPAWTVCAILFASVFGGRAAQLEDAALVEKVKEIIAEVDDIVASQNLTELQTPDIDYPFSPIKIQNGGFGNFSTIELQDGATITEKKLKNNSTVYRFNIKLGLRELRFHYDFQVKTFLFKRTGKFSISVRDNSAEVIGFAIVRSDNSCKAELTSAKVVTFGNYQIDLEPNDFPGVTTISEKILDFAAPYLLTFSNTALQSSLSVPEAQQTFSEVTCKKLMMII